jgi:hypothetical protein
MSSGSGKDLRGRLGGSLVVLVAALALAVPLAWATHTFDDVPDASPHHADVTAIKNAGVTAGCNPPANNLYCPDSPVRRDQMATFMRRGLGRVTGTTGESTQVGSGPAFGPLVDVASTNISVPGVSGTQFAYITGQASLFTNSTRAVACTDAGDVCNVYLYLYDGDTQLALSFIRISADRAGGTLSVSAVQAVTAGTTKTYTLRAQTYKVNTNQVFVHEPSIIAATFPFGGTGGSTIAVSPPAAGPDPTRGDSR